MLAFGCLCTPSSLGQAGVADGTDFTPSVVDASSSRGAYDVQTDQPSRAQTSASVGSASSAESQEAGSARPPRRPSQEEMKTPMGKALKNLQTQNPYLAFPVHHLYPMVIQAEKYLMESDETRAGDTVSRIEQEVEQEEQQLAAAFNLFKPPGKEVLGENEVKTMLKYLGFPCEKRDVDSLLSAIDADGDRQMSLVEFSTYVGKMGGSLKLFEVRRAHFKSSGKGGEDVDQEELRINLLEAGISAQQQAYWKVVVPESELVEASKLVSCQRDALRHIRALAKSNHEAALPKLQFRYRDMGFDDSDLWMTLAWIRELAPIIVHTNLEKMMTFFEKDTHYRNQFETATSGGLLKPAVREKWERDLFGGTYEKAKGFDRCKYGVLNPMNDYRGVVKCAQYGDSYLVLKDVRLRCTFSPEDSANLKADRLAVLDFYAHVLQEYSDKELKETVKVAKSTDAALLGDSSQVGAMKYKEAQLHGPIAFAKHVDRLVAHVKHRGKDSARLKKICEKHGWQFSWMDEERKRMEKEEKHKLGADAWKQKMKDIEAKVPDAKDVPEGYCCKGCGRPVAPGTTAGGKPFKTCCRGCAMGFGHDINCGNIDPSAVGPGMCANGCGRKVNEGKHVSGRQYTTCCRGCARGKHDPWCGKAGETELTNIQPGMCKMNCGRKVAESKGGRKFDTCCRGCAKGKAHTADCAPPTDA